ncbi:MAG: hypothetical protein ACM3ST_16235 [Bdellovibrio bacteriovorus]
MEHDQVMAAVHSGDLQEAIVTPAEVSDGWVLLLVGGDGETIPYTTPIGAPKVFHTLDRATEVARELGFAAIRVEEPF